MLKFNPLTGAFDNLKGYSAYLRLDTSNDPLTGDLEIAKVTPELRLTDTASGLYSRYYKQATSNKAVQYNQVTKYTGTSYSVYFDNTLAQYATIPDHADFDFGTGDFTVEWWEFRTASGTCPVLCRDLQQYTGFMLGYYGSGNLYVYMASAGSWDIANAKFLGYPSWSTWCHYAVVRIGNDFFTYKNGVQQDTWSHAGSLRAGNNNVHVGRYYNQASTNYFMGRLDELRIYKGLGLLPATILAHYNTGRGVYGTLPDANLVAGYHFDEGSLAVAADYSGNSHDMALINSPLWMIGERANPLTPSTSAEALVWSSEDSTVLGEEAIQTIGHSSSQTIIQGSTVSFTSNASTDSSTQFLFNWNAGVPYTDILPGTLPFSIGFTDYNNAYNNWFYIQKGVGAQTTFYYTQPGYFGQRMTININDDLQSITHTYTGWGGQITWVINPNINCIGLLTPTPNYVFSIGSSVASNSNAAYYGVRLGVFGTAWTAGKIVGFVNAGTCPSYINIEGSYAQLDALSAAYYTILKLQTTVPLTTERVLYIDCVNGSRTVTIQGDPVLDNWFDQDVKTTASPVFAGLTVDTTSLYVDSTNHRVGFGTITPKAKIHGTTSTIVGIDTAAIADGDMGNSQLNIWVDEGGDLLMFKTKYSGGGVKSGSLALV